MERCVVWCTVGFKIRNGELQYESKPLWFSNVKHPQGRAVANEGRQEDEVALVWRRREKEPSHAALHSH